VSVSPGWGVGAAGWGGTSEDLTLDNVSQCFTMFEIFARINDNGNNDNGKTMTMTMFHNDNDNNDNDSQ